MCDRVKVAMARIAIDSRCQSSSRGSHRPLLAKDSAIGGLLLAAAVWLRPISCEPVDALPLPLPLTPPPDMDHHLVGCWSWRQNNLRLWSDCCTNISGKPPPKERPWCWPLTAPKRHWARRLWTYERCCEYRTHDTPDGAFYARALQQMPIPGEGCPAPMGWVCDWAKYRTRLQRQTRRHAQVLIAAGQAADPAKLRAAIPVLGFPVSHDPQGRYALRLLRSIDFPVLQLVVVLNLQEHMDPPWIKEALALHPRLHVVRPKINMGCAGGWNAVVETFPSAPYWLISNNDVAFPRGSLQRIAEAMAAGAEAGNSSTERDMPVFMRSFVLRGGINNLPAFALTREAVAYVGLFDENYWPVYAEDFDYDARLKLVGRGIHYQDKSIEVIHGPEDWDEDASGHYSGSGRFLAGDFEAKDSDGVKEDHGQARQTLAKQLEAADNAKHYCLKYGPVSRPDCWSMEYQASGPFAVQGAGWDDWILDPFRRVCSIGAGIVCGYDRRLVLRSQES